MQRTAPGEDTGPADLVSLRRASAALRERIREEKAHVDDYNRELDELIAREQALYRDVSARELAARGTTRSCGCS